MEQLLENETAQAEVQTSGAPAAETEAPASHNPYASGEAAGAPVQKKEKKKKHVGRTVFAVVVCLLLFFNMLFSAAALGLQAYSLIDRGVIDPEEWFEPDDPAREDDVTIGWEYEIKSTLPISDAYKSGDTAGLSDRDLETLDMASAILEQIVTDGMTDVEKEAAVYEWLTTKLESENGILTVIPTGSDESDNPYGVLKYRSAVCVGYATTFRLFMQMLGIECMVVHDSSLSHSWDLVKLDGEWYHTDCYFDASQGSYRHFNITDEVRAQEETWNTEFFPAATGTKYNYAIYNCETLPDIYAFPAWLRDSLDAEKRTFSCAFADGIEDEQAALYMVEAAVNAASGSGLYGDFWLDHYWTRNDAGDYVACFFNESSSYEPSYEVTDEERDRISQSVADAFGVEPDWSEIGPNGKDYGYEEEDSSWYYYDGEGVSSIAVPMG